MFLYITPQRWEPQKGSKVVYALRETFSNTISQYKKKSVNLKTFPLKYFYTSLETLENLTNIIVFFFSAYFRASQDFMIFSSVLILERQFACLRGKKAFKTDWMCADVRVMMCLQWYCSTMSPSAGLELSVKLNAPLSLDRIKFLFF